jgi:uncharacterized protein
MPRMDSRALGIILPGGSGQVGTLLARHFHSHGHTVVVLVRRPVPAPWRVLQWDALSLGPWASETENADLVINLAGRSVNCRYTQANRREILESRTRSTRIVGEAIRRSAHPPKIWMNASTATIYRHALDRPMDETTGEMGGAENQMRRPPGVSALRSPQVGRMHFSRHPPLPLAKLRSAVPW